MTQQSVQLPPVVKFVLPAQHAVQILEALGSLPFKTAQPIVKNFEEQLLAQQVRPQPAAASPAVSAAEAVAETIAAESPKQLDLFNDAA